MGALRAWPLALAAWIAGGAMATDVHMGKLEKADAARWTGLAVGDVADEAQVERVVLLRAVTSAPAALDLENVRRLLAESAAAPLRPAEPRVPMRVADGNWHALLLMRDGRVLELEVHGPPPGRACLRASDGGSGCFEPVR